MIIMKLGTSVVILFKTCGGLMLAASLPAATVTLHPVADTTLFQSFTNNNLGASSLAAGTTANKLKSRALIQFDPAFAIPTNATVTAASLTVNVTKVPGNGGVASDFDLRRVLQSWAEGRQGAGDNTGAPAATNETTWKARFFPATLWTQPGGAIGADFSTIVSASQSISGTNDYTFGSTPSLVADVQAWVTNQSANFGWVLMSQLESNAETARRFGSRESSTQAPTLVVDYMIAAEPIHMAGMAITNQVATIAWVGGAPPFQLQQRRSMSDTNWFDVGVPIATTSVSIAVSGNQSFYRIRQTAP